MAMIEPRPATSSPAPALLPKLYLFSNPLISRPTCTPAIVSWLRPPKFACTRTPTVLVVGPKMTRRDAVPVPHLNPRQLIPVPPPTFPSGTGPDFRSEERRVGKECRSRGAQDRSRQRNKDQ